MESNKTFSRKHPIIMIIVIELCLMIMLTIGGAIAHIKQLSDYAPVIIAFIPIATILIFYFTWKRKWAYFGFNLSRTKNNWIYYVPLLIILVIICFQGYSALPVETIAFYIGFAILVGFVEESIYRGIMVKILLPLLSGQSLSETGLQLIYSLLIGIVLAQFFIKTGNLVPLILFHTIHNLIQFLGDEGSNIILDVTIIVILCLTAIFHGSSLHRDRGVTSNQERYKKTSS